VIAVRVDPIHIDRVHPGRPEGEIVKLPPELRLIPGMPVEAFLSTDARTPLEFLIRQLSDYFVRAFWET